MQTFLEYKTRLRAEMWPAGESRALRIAHDPFFNEGMMDLQRWVPCLKQYNTDTFGFADTKWDDAKSVVDAPYGEIRRVYTVAGGIDRWRDKVRYRSGTYEQALCWSNQLYAAITPTNTGLPELPYGVKNSDASQDSPYGRARIGLWAVNRHKLYLVPYLQSTEMAVVEWDGEKSRWQDSDGVDETYWTSDVDEAVKYYVLFKHELMWGDRAFSRDLKALYDSKLADLINKCLVFTKAQEEKSCGATTGGDQLVGLTTDRTDDDDDSNDPDTTEADHVLFVHVADVGIENSDSSAVAAKAESDSPELLIVGGDISYGGTGDYQTDFGDNYQWAIDQGIVLPCLGNHDVDVLADYHAFFDQPNGRNYYEFVKGPIHFFILNSDPREPDGRSTSSAQYEWLRVKSLLSPARWKIVIMHHPAYSSGTTYGSQAAIQYPLATLGIDLSLEAHEHNYERVTAPDGVPHIVNGLGGAAKYPFGSAVSGSQFRYNAKFGRLVGTVDCDTMRLDFKTVDNDIVDTLTITK